MNHKISIMEATVTTSNTTLPNFIAIPTEDNSKKSDIISAIESGGQQVENACLLFSLNAIKENNINIENSIGFASVSLDNQIKYLHNTDYNDLIIIAKSAAVIENQLNESRANLQANELIYNEDISKKITEISNLKKKNNIGVSSSSLLKFQARLEKLDQKVNGQQIEINELHEKNHSQQTELNELHDKNHFQQTEINELHENNRSQQLQIDEQKTEINELHEKNHYQQLQFNEQQIETAKRMESLENIIYKNDNLVESI